MALPQLVLGSVVALLLYQKWVDARLVFAAGLALIALACLSGSQLTADWNREQFVVAQTLQAFGQPMAVVSMLFLITSVVQPEEGPYISGTINALRAFGSLAGRRGRRPVHRRCAAASMRRCCWTTRAWSATPSRMRRSLRS